MRWIISVLGLVLWGSMDKFQNGCASEQEKSQESALVLTKNWKKCLFLMISLVSSGDEPYPSKGTVPMVPKGTL